MTWTKPLGLYRRVERRESNYLRVDNQLQAIVYDVTVVQLVIFWVPIWTWEFDR